MTIRNKHQWLIIVPHVCQQLWQENWQPGGCLEEGSVARPAAGVQNVFSKMVASCPICLPRMPVVPPSVVYCLYVYDDCIVLLAVLFKCMWFMSCLTGEKLHALSLLAPCLSTIREAVGGHGPRGMVAQALCHLAPCCVSQP